MDDLVASVKAHGVVEPLTVTELGDGRFQIVTRHRRFRAAKLAGKDMIEILIREPEEKWERRKKSLVSNVQRADSFAATCRMSLGRAAACFAIGSSTTRVKLPPIRGETKRVQQSTGTTDRRAAQEVQDRLAHERWEQARLGVKARHDWQEAAERWILETKHKATRGDDIAKLRWLHPYLGDKYLDEIDRTLIDRIKFDREKIAAGSTTNRYLALRLDAIGGYVVATDKEKGPSA